MASSITKTSAQEVNLPSQIGIYLKTSCLEAECRSDIGSVVAQDNSLSTGGWNMRLSVIQNNEEEIEKILGHNSMSALTEPLFKNCDGHLEAYSLSSNELL